jgi:RimJ/RimL family protein N-acetyltransferase
VSAAIESERLLLIAVTSKILRAEREGAADLAVACKAEVPPDWPPEHLDSEAIDYMMDLIERGRNAPAWGSRYFALKRRGAPLLVGAGGYKGGPRDGAVEIGYSIVPSLRRQGYASEATRALVEFAFKHRAVDRVIAHTLPHLCASIGVLEKCGFRYQGDGEEEGSVLYVLRRS